MMTNPISNSPTNPTISNANANQSATAGTAFTYDATQNGTTFTDEDPLTYTVTINPLNSGLSASNGVISGTPAQAGTINITISANDGSGGETSNSFSIVTAPAVTSNRPNILFVVSDDQGLDSSAEYNLSTDLPATPNLSALADDGIIFENAWVAPSCSPTRGALLTGKHSFRTNVFAPGNPLPSSETILHSFMENNPETSVYANALIGKWHLGGGDTGPNDFGVDYFAGIINGGVNNYSNWDLNINGNETRNRNYATTELTDLAIDWVDDQTNPWFLMLSYNAPHSPEHLPPTALHTRSLSGTVADINNNPRAYYLAAIEAMDTEFGRFWNSLTTVEQNNTIVIFLGDNGTPRNVKDNSAAENGEKGSLFQGGVAVPMFVSGTPITRIGEREEALITHTDFFPTIAELSGAELPVYQDGQSFADLLDDSSVATREFAFTAGEDGWTIRDATYKLIQQNNGSRALYNLDTDPQERTDLLRGTTDVTAILNRLVDEADAIQNTPATNP